MNSIRLQTIWSIIPIFLTSVISIISVPIYYKVLGAEMYAIWFYVATLTGAFGFMDLGIGVSVGRFMGVALGSGDDQAAREFWSTGGIIVLPLIAFFAILFVLIGVVWGPGWFKVSGDDGVIMRWAIAFGGIGLFLSYCSQMWFMLSTTHLDFRFISLIRTIVALSTTIGSVLLAVISKNAACLVAFTTIISAIQFYFLIRHSNRHYCMHVRFSDFRMHRMKQMMPYTMKTFAQLLSNSIIGSMDRIILGRLCSASEFASYGVSLNVASRFQSISQAVMGPVFANSSRGVGGDPSRKPSAIYEESIILIAPIYLFITLWLFAWSDPLLKFWLGEDNGNLTSLSLPWVTAALSIAAIANISTAQLGSLDRVGTGFLLSTTQNLLSGIFVFAGWHVDGLRGASVALLIARFPSLIQDAIVRKSIGFRFNFKRMAPIGIALFGGILSLALASILSLLQTSMWNKIPIALFIFISFAFLFFKNLFTNTKNIKK